MAANAVLGGRELDVRLYVPGATIAGATSAATAGIGNLFTNNQFTDGNLATDGSWATLTFSPPTGQRWASAALVVTLQYAGPGDFAGAITTNLRYDSAGGLLPGVNIGSDELINGESWPATPGSAIVTVALSAGHLAVLNNFCMASPAATSDFYFVLEASTTTQTTILAAELQLSPVQRPWVRARLPEFEITDVDWEVTDSGGPGEGHVQIQANWEGYSFQGNERVDIYTGGDAGATPTLLYRGDLLLPESHLDLPETKSLALYGRKAMAGGWQVERRYVYPALTDLATVAADLFSDVAVVYEPGLLSDLQATGAYVQPGEQLDFTGSSVADALDSLARRAPDQVTWGFDATTDPLGGLVPVNRLYVRPRASTNKYDYVVGDTVQALIDPVDTTSIVNRIVISGGPAVQPNLANNGGFERPLTPDEHHGNLLLDGSFDLFSVFNYTRGFFGLIVTGGSGSNPYWTMLNDASLKDTVHAGGGQGNPNDGRWWVSLDQATETVQQAVGVDAAKVLRGCASIRRGTKGTAATCSLYVDALDAGGGLLGSVGHPSNPVDPGLLVTSLSDTIYQRVTWDADLSGFAGCTQARLRIVGHSGTNNNDGVFVDTCGLWYRDGLVQQGWLPSQSGTLSEPSGPASPAPVIDWAHKKSSGDGVAPLAGGYCVKVVANPAAGGWVEIQQELYAKVKGLRFQTYTVLAQFRTLSGDATVTAGAYGYQSDGTLWAVLEGDQFIGGGDGNWHTVYARIEVEDADADLQPFFRVYSAGTVYFDNVMVVEAAAPPECLEPPAGDYNWWEGANYQWTVESSNASLGLSADLANSVATYGLRSKTLDNALVIDRASAIAYAVGYFQANAGPLTQVRLTAVNDERNVGLDGRVRVHGLPAGSPAAGVAFNPVRIRWHYAADSVVCDVDLNNRRPDMAYLFLQERGVQAGQGDKGTGGQGDTGNSGSGPYNSSTGGYASGASVSTGNLARLTGDAQQVSAPTVFKPATDTTIVGLQRDASGQTADLVTVYDESGGELAHWLPSGAVEAPALSALGLTGATAASRYAGATSSAAPTTGTFVTGDFVVDQAGAIWICTAGGTPGTWVDVAGSGGGTVWHSGSGVPSSGLGANGDYYLNTANGDVYTKVAGSWGSPIENLTGPAGPAGAAGATGATGAAGAAGSVWYSGAGAPSGGTGVDGDYYLRTATGDVYKKVAGSWGSPVENLVGPTGATGPSGAAASRQTVSVTTASLAAGATESLTVALAKGYKLIHVTASAAARVRLYGLAAYRSADASRAIGTDPASGSENGIVCDLALGYLGSALSWDLSPEGLGSNLDTPVTTTAYYAITNLGTGAAAITVTFVYLPLES